jgi:hypothetical protein
MAKCEVMKTQTNIILTHVGNTRKLIHKTLMERGFGVGAIILIHDSWTGDKHECLIPSHEFIKTVTPVDYQKVKYKKSVRAHLFCFGEIPSVPDSLDGLIRCIHRGRVNIPAYRLADMSDTLYGDMFMNPNERVPSYEYRVQAELLAPSDETDIKEEWFHAQVRIPERLTTTKNPDQYRNAITTT